MKNRTLIRFIWIVVYCVMFPYKGTGEDLASSPHLRHPIRMAWSNQQQSQLIISNRDAGSLSVVDIAEKKVVGEYAIADSISDLLIPENSQQILVLDNNKHGLRVIHFDFNAIHTNTSQFIPLADDPNRIVIHPDGTQIAIASKWSRRITLLSKNNTEDLSPLWQLEQVIDLTFAPGELVFVPNSNDLLIADAFNGMLVMMNLDSQTTYFACQLPVNNIANLTFASKSDTSTLWLSGESLNSYATTINPEVTWGVLMDNQVRSIPLTQLQDPQRTAMHLGTVYGMGDETGPGGDPGRVLVKSDGALITALQGVDRIAIRPQLPRSYTDRIQVGDRPIDMLLNHEETMLYVLNQFSDSISVIDLQQSKVTHEISLGPQPKLTDSDKGERLFFDATLSLRGWYSCHSCHTEGHTTGLLNDNLGDDHFGSPKRILTLLGAHATSPFSWLGKMENLEDQIAKSLEKTMLHRGSTKDKARLMAAYLRTLKSPPSINHARGNFDPDLFNQGKDIFRQEGCQECHKPPHYTYPETFDVGLKDTAGNIEFNPPSLLGLSQRDTYLHDNSAATVEELLFHQNHPDPTRTPIAKQDRNALLYFLNSL
jgi:YVTN family beta-propeller protein